MPVACLTCAAQCRSGRPFRIFPLTIYEANFRQKLTKNFQCNSNRPENQPLLRPAKTHLERELLPEGVCLRVRLVVCQPSTTLAKSPWLMATSKLKGKSSGNSPHLQGNIEEGKSKKKSLWILVGQEARGKDSAV